MRFSWSPIGVLPLAAAMLGCTPPPTQDLALADMVPRSDQASAEAPAATVYFEVGSATLNAEAIAMLDRLASDPTRGGWSRVTLSGHADRSGSARLNRQLSAARVAAVRAYLVDSGVPAALMVAEAFGKRQAKSRIEAEDRRVEIYVTR